MNETMKQIIEALEFERKHGGRTPVSPDELRAAAETLAERIRDEAVAIINACREEGESDLRVARDRIKSMDLQKLIDSD